MLKKELETLVKVQAEQIDQMEPELKDLRKAVGILRDNAKAHDLDIQKERVAHKHLLEKARLNADRTVSDLHKKVSRMENDLRVLDEDRSKRENRIRVLEEELVKERDKSADYPITLHKNVSAEANLVDALLRTYDLVGAVFSGKKVNIKAATKAALAIHRSRNA